VFALVCLLSTDERAADGTPLYMARLFPLREIDALGCVSPFVPPER